MYGGFVVITSMEPFPNICDASLISPCHNVDLLLKPVVPDTPTRHIRTLFLDLQSCKMLSLSLRPKESGESRSCSKIKNAFSRFYFGKGT